MEHESGRVEQERGKDAAGGRGSGIEAEERVKIFGWLVGPGFVLLALGMVFGLSSGDVPSAESPSVSATALVAGPLRESLKDPPMTEIGGIEQRCISCHQLFESLWDGSKPLRQHMDVQIKHGVDGSCYGCHSRENREKLELKGGELVSFTEVARLCGECHGPVLRDWQRGTHGKTLGYWDANLGEVRRLGCTECHDPHSPAYEGIIPLPGPHTLRMGERLNEHGGESNRNPLRYWQENKGHKAESGGSH